MGGEGGENIPMKTTLIVMKNNILHLTTGKQNHSFPLSDY